MKARASLFVADFIFLSCSFFLSFRWFHLDAILLWKLYALFLLIKFALFIRLGLYRAILRFAGFPLAAIILKASTLASGLCVLIMNFPNIQTISLGFFVTDYLMTTFLIGLIRFAPRFFIEFWRIKGTKRIMIYGAGELGEEVARKLLRDPGEYNLIGFVDDKPSKIGKRLHNLPIYGPTEPSLSKILKNHRISELIIAISLLGGEGVRRITGECRKNGVFCRIVPTFNDMLKKDINIKNIDISDLLRREPKDLDEPQIRRFIKGKIILITGAGGSIGAELSRQCIQYGVKRLVLTDYSEFNLYSLQEELAGSPVSIRFCLLNVLSSVNLERIIQEEKPSILFHAAAYKHVPIVEENPFEGVVNNVRGTINVAQLAEKYGVEKFILISTDKAVRPTSVMGVTKRIAELYIQNFNTRSRVEFVAVRFGNVLGSSGSVIPKFIDQINKGGPVTVTHPEVTRYFMLITEAVQLVLQAASIGNGGEIFILNMGKPVLINEMAEDLIFLSGQEPHKDIKIEFTGLRPGEKLYEELLLDETEKETQYENITIGRATYVDWDQFLKKVETLLKGAESHDRMGTLNALKDIVPEFHHKEHKEIEHPLSAERHVIPLRSAH